MVVQRRKLLATLLITILLPLLAYIMYEVSTVRDNEEVIEGVYKDQLASILFSVNQYSNDIMTSLVSKVEGEYDPQSPVQNEQLSGILGQNGFNAVSIVDLNNPGQFQFIFRKTENENLENFIHSFISSPAGPDSVNQAKVRQLIGYFESGYRKLEPLGLLEVEENVYQAIAAVLSIKGNYYLFLGFIDPLYFIQEVMSPKMQQTGDEKMIIALQRQSNSEIIFSTDSISNKIFVTSKMWLFPDLLVGVSPLNKTVSELVNQRMKYNLIAIGMLIVLLVAGFILIFRNIDKEVRLAQTKSDFVSNVSHELRTPLSLISMFAETLMLGRVPNEKKKQEYFEIIYKETNRLTNIVNRILNFSRIEANRRTYTMDEVELNSLTSEIIRDYSFHLELNGFEFELHSKDELIQIQADREAIYEAVVNLIDNAMKYSNDTKRLDLFVSRNETTASIEIQDKGVGIPEDKLKHIFEKFYRVTEGDIYSKQGAGLGLTIIKHIMDAHKGKIEVESKLKQGSTFRLIFNLS